MHPFVCVCVHLLCVCPPQSRHKLDTTRREFEEYRKRIDESKQGRRDKKMDTWWGAFDIFLNPGTSAQDTLLSKSARTHTQKEKGMYVMCCVCVVCVVCVFRVHDVLMHEGGSSGMGANTVAGLQMRSQKYGTLKKVFYSLTSDVNTLYECRDNVIKARRPHTHTHHPQTTTIHVCVCVVQAVTRLDVPGKPSSLVIERSANCAKCRIEREGPECDHCKANPIFDRSHTHTERERERARRIYMYIYMCVCVCVCAGWSGSCIR